MCEIRDADEYDLESSFLGNCEIGLLGKPPMDQTDKTVMKDEPWAIALI